MLLQLNELKKLSTKECGKTIQEYKKFMLENVARTPEFQSYIKTQCRLGTFFFKTIALENYKKIEKVIKMILYLNHGQAAVERGVSVNKNLLQVNMTEASIVAKRMIYDHMISKNLQP